MSASFSVIIPARNAGQTLGLCLDAVFGQIPQPSEVWVVNDGSEDQTGETALRYPCRILDVRIQDGAMKPRLEAAAKASGEILIFVDADVVLPEGAFARVLNHFQDGTLSALTGRLSPKSRAPGFFTRYKNEYMHYIFGRRAGETDFLYGSFFAVRRRDMIFFEPLTKPFTDVADSELGLQLARRGKRMVLDADLEVEHLKFYNFAALIRNDFTIPFMFMQLYLTYREPGIPKSKSRFSHATLGQTAACAAAFWGLSLGVAAFLSGSFILQAGAVLCAGVFFFHWHEFFRRLFSARPAFAVGAVFFTLLDAAVMFAGMAAGFFYYYGRNRRGSSKLPEYEALSENS